MPQSCRHRPSNRRSLIFPSPLCAAVGRVNAVLSTTAAAIGRVSAVPSYVTIFFKKNYYFSVSDLTANLAAVGRASDSIFVFFTPTNYRFATDGRIFFFVVCWLSDQLKRRVMFYVRIIFNIVYVKIILEISY